MGARLWYRSCPAVSQISNFTVVSSRHTDWARNAAWHKGEKERLPGVLKTQSLTLFFPLPSPDQHFNQLKMPLIPTLTHTHTLPISLSSPPMVVSWNSSNCPLTKRSTRLDLPTAMSPSSTNLNWQILVCGSVPLERPPLPLELIPALVGDGRGAGPPPWSGPLALPNRV